MAGMWKSVSGLFRPKSFFRGFRTSAKRMDKAESLGGETQKPTNFQKKALVWSNMYKNVDEVPERVSTTKLKMAQGKFRMYGTSFLIIGGAIGSLVYYNRSLKNTGQDESNVRHQHHQAKEKTDAEKEHRRKSEKTEAKDASDAEKKK